MAKCVCSEAEVECKCGCGCICIDDDTIPEQDRCLTMCFKCDDPKGTVAGFHDVHLGLDAVVGRLNRRKMPRRSARLRIRFNQAPLGTIALVLEKVTGTRLAVPASRLAAKQTLVFQGTLDGIVRKLGLTRI